MSQIDDKVQKRPVSFIHFAPVSLLYTGKTNTQHNQAQVQTSKTHTPLFLGVSKNNSNNHTEHNQYLKSTWYSLTIEESTYSEIACAKRTETL